MVAAVSFVSYCSISAAIFAVTISSAYYTSYSHIAEQKTSVGVAVALLVEILQSRIYVLTCMNTALCMLILFGKFIQFIFFGALRVTETKVSGTNTKLRKSLTFPSPEHLRPITQLHII